MVTFVLDDFWCHVFWGSAKSVGSFMTLDFFDEPKVCKLKVAIICDEHVLWLKVSIDALLAMDVLKTKHHLRNIELGMLDC